MSVKYYCVNKRGVFPIDGHRAFSAVLVCESGQTDAFTPPRDDLHPNGAPVAELDGSYVFEPGSAIYVQSGVAKGTYIMTPEMVWVRQMGTPPSINE